MPRMTRRLVRLIALTLILAPTIVRAEPAATSRPAEVPAEGVFDESWFIVMMMGQHCGHMHTTMSRAGDEIKTQSAIVIELTRSDTKIRVSIEQEFRESLAGAARSFRQVQMLGEIPSITSGTIENGKLKFVEEQAGARHEKLYNWDPEAKFAWGQMLEQRKRGLTPGTTFTLKTYDAAIRPDGPVETVIEVIGKEDVDVLGTKRRLNHVVATLSLGKSDNPATAGLPTELASDNWLDDDAEPVVTTMDLGIIKASIYKSTREKAMATGAPVEMFLQTFVKAKGAVGKGATRVKYRLRLPADAKMTLPELPNTDMQTFKRVSDREAILEVTRTDWEELKSSKVKGSPQEDYLRPSAMLDINNRHIKRLAKRAVGDAADPIAKADALRKFVTDYIKDKSLGVGFATATEVAKNRRGDCTEHGVLLAALARAAGIPARGASGLIDIPAAFKVEGLQFGYHMWTQVYLNGKWVDLDAAMRQTECAPTHIAVSLLPLNDEGMIDSVRGLLPLMGRLEIEIVESE